jgi:hypothetical protein
MAVAGDTYEWFHQALERCGLVPLCYPDIDLGLCKLWLHAKRRRGHGLFIHARMAPQF